MSCSTVRHDHHDHKDENPFVIRDHQPTLKGPYFSAHQRNGSQRSDDLKGRVGYQAQLGNELDPKIQLPKGEKTIAIGLGLTTRGQWEPQYHPDKLASILPFFKLLDSFCRTASFGFNYHFYIAHDLVDPFFSKNFSHHHFIKTFYTQVATGCPEKLNVTLHMVECKHSGHPAWAQNDAMMAAYMDNMAYYYR